VCVSSWYSIHHVPLGTYLLDPMNFNKRKPRKTKCDRGCDLSPQKRDFDCCKITRFEAFSVRTFYSGLGMGLKPVEIQSPHEWHAKKGPVGEQESVSYEQWHSMRLKSLSLTPYASGGQNFCVESGQHFEHNRHLPNAYDLQPADQITLQIPGVAIFSEPVCREHRLLARW